MSNEPIVEQESCLVLFGRVVWTDGFSHNLSNMCIGIPTEEDGQPGSFALDDAGQIGPERASFTNWPSGVRGSTCNDQAFPSAKTKLHHKVVGIRRNNSNMLFLNSVTLRAIREPLGDPELDSILSLLGCRGAKNVVVLIVLADNVPMTGLLDPDHMTLCSVKLPHEHQLLGN